ncbi:MAG: hypothetical protein JO131_08910, partial [Gammaproteobacteria bacterium]|nr:hypothetical protein [Gammaproteobacteria bacterium]
VKLIKEFHASACPPADPYTPPEQNAIQPGQFRDTIVGTKIRDNVSEGGIFEILTLLEDEAKKGFNKYQGTWIGPDDPYTRNLSLSESIRHDNLAEKLKEADSSKSTLAKKIYADMQERKYSFLYPRHSAKYSTIRPYMEYELEQLVKAFNKEIKSEKNPEQIKKSILVFIKKCIRLHPFRDLNHRTFALCVLNFLFLSNNIGYCALKDRRIFSLIDINETLKAVNQAITPVFNLNLIKQSIISNISVYSSNHRFSLFGYHHAKRAAEVKKQISSAKDPNQIREILKNQYDLFFNPSTVTPTSYLNERFSLAKNLKNRNKGEYSSAIEQAVDTYNQSQSDPTLRIAKSP